MTNCLLSACKAGNVSTFVSLLQETPDPNIVDDAGLSLLHLAVQVIYICKTSDLLDQIQKIVNNWLSK